jgi:hypothetical protein
MRRGNILFDPAPYIAGAAVIAFALGYCAQPFTAGLNASGRIGAQSELARPMNIVDRSHKGDRLSGQAASGNAAIGSIEPRPDQTVPRDVRRPSKLRLQLPDGCETAFGPLTAEDRKNIADRCLT